MNPIPASSITMLAVMTSWTSTSSGVAAAPTAISVARPPAGDLLVEPRDPAAGDRHLKPVDAHRSDRREQPDQPVAAELHTDAGAHHAPAEGDRPAPPVVAGGGDLPELGARAGEVDLLAEHGADQVVDAGQVLVVDHPALDVPGGDQRPLLGAALVAHGERGEGHVDLGLAGPQAAGQRQHRGGHVGGTGAGGEQQIAHPETEVQGEGELAGLRHRT